MKYLITGGAGFIGSHLADAIISRGDSVIALDNLSTGDKKNTEHLIKNPNFKLVEGSILDAKLIEEISSEVDHILHMAAAVGVFNIIGKPLDSLTTNLTGTENVLKAASRNCKPVLIASSSEVYGKNTNVPLHENSDRVVGSPLKSRWSYSEAKAIDESLGYFYFKEKSLPVRIVRLFNTVGSRQVGNYGMVLPRFIRAALKNENIQVYGNGKQTRCFCHVSDAVTGILSVVDSNATIGDVYNIGNNEEISILDLAKKIIELTNSKSKVEFVPYNKAYSDGFEDLPRRIPAIDKLNRVTGWSPKRNLEKTIIELALKIEVI